MIISNKQLDNSLIRDEKKLTEILAKDLQKNQPEDVDILTKETLFEMVYTSIKNAKEHGCNTLEEIYAWSSLMFSVSPVFYKQTKINKVLTSKSLDMTMMSRLDHILEGTNISTEEWDEVHEIDYEVDIWFLEDGYYETDEEYLGWT